MNEKILGAIASALHLDASEFVAALKDGENWLPDDQLTAKAAEIIGGQVKAAKDAQLKRGTRESWTSVERWMKAKGFDNTEKLQGSDLLDAFAEHLQGLAPEGGDGGKKPAEMSADELAKLPTVKTLMQKAKEEAGKAMQALQVEFDNYKTTAARDRVKMAMQTAIPEILETAGVILEIPGIAKKADRIAAIGKLVDAGELGLDESGKIVFVNADGTPKTDDYGKAVDFQKHIASLGAAIFGIQKQDPSKAGANPPANGGGSGDYKPAYKFATAEEYAKAKFDEPDAAKRAQMAADWAHQQQAAGQ